MKHFHFVQEAKRPTLREFRNEFLFQIKKPRMLTPQRRIVVVDHHRNPVIIRGQCDDIDLLFLIMVVNRLVDDQIVFRCVLNLEARLEETVHVWLRAPIPHGRLIVIKFDQDVVDLKSDQRCHHMLDRMNARRSELYGRPAGNVDDMIDISRNFRLPWQIDPPPSHAVILRCGLECHGADIPRVQSYPTHGNGLLNRALLNEHEVR